MRRSRNSYSLAALQYWRLIVGVCCIAWLAPVAHAQTPVGAAAPFSVERCVVWQREGTGLYSRIRGHTNDMRIEVFSEESTPIPADVAAQWHLAQAISQRYAAALVTWFDPAALFDGHLVLRIALPREPRRIERNLGPTAGNGEHPVVPSVALEVAAVIVREAAQAVLMAEAATTEARVGSGNQIPPDAPVPRPDPSSFDSPPVREARSSSLRMSGSVQPRRSSNRRTRQHSAASDWAVGMGPSLTVDGIGQQGVTAGLLARVDRRVALVEVGAAAGANLPITVSSEYGVLRLMSGRLTASGNVALWTGSVQASLGLQVGLIVYRRTNLKLEAGVSDRGGSTLLLGVMGPELRLRFPLPVHWLSTELALGGQVPTSVLDVGYEVDGKFRSVTKAWPIQPYIHFGISAGR
jgi:hypothetical protein